MQRPSKSQVAVFVCILAGYVAVRFWNITASCLWFDEIFSVHAAEHSWSSILNFVALDLIHPPLFYILLKLWIAAGGESLLWLRALQVAFSILAVVPFVFFCRELRLSYWTTILAFFLIAVNGSLIKYAQEVRMYSMLMCISLFSLWLFARFFRTGKGIAVLTIVNLILVYTHYFGWLVVLSEVAAILFFQRIKWRPILMMSVVVFVGFLPWLTAVVNAATSGSELSQNIGWMQRPGFLSVAQLTLNLVEPFYYMGTSVDPASIYRISIPLLLIALAGVSLHFLNSKRFDRSQSEVSYILLISIFLPIVSAFIASWILPNSIWGARHLIIAFAPASILIAYAIATVPKLPFRVASVALIALFSSYALAVQLRQEPPEYTWCSWEKLAVEWRSKPFIEPGSTKLYVFEDLVAYHFWFALRDNANYKVNKVDGFPGIVEDKAYFLPRGFDQVAVKQLSDSFSEDSFWIAFRDSNPSAATPGLSMIPYTPPVINYFFNHGFNTQDVTKTTAGDETAYLVKLVRLRPR
jgi:hypothetical protein